MTNAQIKEVLDVGVTQALNRATARLNERDNAITEKTMLTKQLAAMVCADIAHILIEIRDAIPRDRDL